MRTLRLWVSSPRLVSNFMFVLVFTRPIVCFLVVRRPQIYWSKCVRTRNWAIKLANKASLLLLISYVLFTGVVFLLLLKEENMLIGEKRRSTTWAKNQRVELSTRRSFSPNYSRLFVNRSESTRSLCKTRTFPHVIFCALSVSRKHSIKTRKYSLFSSNNNKVSIYCSLI